ncbi:MAG: hypothetical protein ABWZ25_17825 [Chitinophagaceae bacterium]
MSQVTAMTTINSMCDIGHKGMAVYSLVGNFAVLHSDESLGLRVPVWSARIPLLMEKASNTINNGAVIAQGNARNKSEFE